MRALISLSVLLATSVGLSAQEQLRVIGPQPATVRLGDSSRVRIEVHGRGARPKTPPVPNVDGLDMSLVGPLQQMFQSLVGGRIEERVTVSWELLIEPRREGSFTIPAFEVWTGTRAQRVESIQLEVVKELRGAEYGYLDIQLQQRRVYVHEPIRIDVEFGVDAGLQLIQQRARTGERYLDCEVQAAWLTEMEGAEPLENGGDDRGTPIVLNRSELVVAEYDPDHQRQKRTWRSFRFERSFLPVRPGVIRLEAPLLRYHVQTGQQRVDIFGGRRPGGSENYYVYGEPLELEVLPIPEEGRPVPYYGSVGRFTLSAVADRDSVKVGSSVKLTLSIGGQGNFEFLRVPDLSAWERRSLHLLGQTEGRSAEGVVVTYDLTPLDASVNELPAVEWNWFDTTPGVEAFAVAATNPIPLRVEALAAGEALQPLPADEQPAVTPGVDDIFDLPDLGGTPLVERPVSSATAWLASLLPWALVASVWLGQSFRRRRRQDLVGSRARAAARTYAKAMQQAEDPTQALAAYLGDRLGLPAAAVIDRELESRLTAAGVDAALAWDVAQALERGTAARYGGGGGLEADMARRLVQRLEAIRLVRGTVRGGGAVGLLLAVLLLGGSLCAQRQLGEEHYRRGDYAAAELAFAKAIEQDPDRRLWYARGNCFFRLGDLPRARWAYECARIGMRGNAALAANLRLVQQRLQLGSEDGSFGATLAALRDRFSSSQLVVACATAMTMAAALLLFGWRRSWCRWLGVLVLVPGVMLALELLLLRPNRPMRAVALQKVELLAEPREGLEAVARVAPGVLLEWRGGAAIGGFVRVAVDGLQGYAATENVAPVR